MSDVNANIGININAAPALAELKNLQRQLANFHSQVAKGSAASAAAQKGLQNNLLNAINATGKFHAQMGLVRTSTESFTHALENNKLSMGQYFKYAGGATKSFGKMFKNEFDTIGRVAEERVKKMQTQYIKMGRDAQGATKAMSVTPLSLNMKDAATQTALAAQKQALFNQLVRQGSTNLLNFGKNTQWAGRQLMVGFSVPLAYFGSMASKTFMDLEAQAIRFKRVYGDMFTTTEETNKALQDIQLLAEGFTKYGVAVADTMKMAADAAATGKSGADLTAQVAEATRLAVLGGVEQQQALETTISLTNAFGISAQDLKKNIDFLNAVENQTVTNIEDLTIAIPKAGPVVKQLGGDVQDLAFFLTAMKEGGINASEGANALKSGLASLINPTKKASEMLSGFGINIKAIVEGNAGNLKETVVDFAQALDTLAPLDRAKAIEQLFGKFQFARLSTLFQNITKDGTQANRVLDLTAKSVEELAILSERELKTVEDAVGTNFRASIEKLKLEIAPIGKTFLQAVTPIIKTVSELFEKFNNLSDGTKKFLVVATTLVGVVGPVLLMTFGLLANGVANIIKLFLALRVGFLKMTGDSKSLGATTSYLTQQQLEAETVAASLNQAHTRLTQQFELESGAVMALRNAYVQATVAAAAFAKANPGMMSGKVGKPKKYAKGTTGAQGTDTVPAMLTPGEAVIPVETAQDPQFKPLIEALVTGRIRKYETGTGDVQPFGNSPKFQPKVDLTGAPASAARSSGSYMRTHNLIMDRINASNVKPVAEAITKTVFAHAVDKRTVSGSAVPASLSSKGFAQANAYTTLGFDISEELHKALTNNNANVKQYIEEIKKPLSTSTMTAKLIDQGISAQDAKRTSTSIRDNLVKSLTSMPENSLIGDKTVYSRMGNLKTGILGGIVQRAQGGVLGDAVKKLYDPSVYSPRGTSSIALNDTRMISDVISQVSKTKTNQSVLKALRDVQKLNPETKIPVSLDQNGNIKAFERPEISKNTGLLNGRKVIGVLNGDKFETARQQTGGNRKIVISAKARNAAKATLLGLDMPGKDVAVHTGETVVDTVTGKQTKLTQNNTRPKPSNVKTASPRDNRIARIRPRQIIIPGAVNGMDEFGNPLKTASGVPQIPFSSLPEQTKIKQSSIKQAKAIEESIKATEETTKKTKTMGEKVNAASGAFAGLTVLGSFLGGSIGEMSQKLVPFAIGIQVISQLLPSLKSGFAKLSAFLVANPYVAIAAALVALVAGWKMLNDKAKAQAAAQSKYIDQISATTEKMKEVGLLTGKVGASEIMARRREGGTANKFVTGFERAGQQFGANFLESEVGKSVFETFKTNLAKGGSSAMQTLALELSSYVSDGLMTAEDANSVARSIGINMSDMTISANIQGQIREVLGPDGKDLATNPLVVRLKISEESKDSAKDYVKSYMQYFEDFAKDAKSGKNILETFNPVGQKKALQDYLSASKIAAGAGASGVQSLEIIQSQRDAQSKLYDDQIRTLEAQLKTTTDRAKQLEIETKIQTLTSQQASDDQKIAAVKKQSLKDQIKAFTAISKAGKIPGINYNPQETGYITALDQQIKDKYKNDPLASVFMGAAGKTQSKTLEVTIKTLVGAGDLTPNSGTKLLNMFGKEGEAQLEALITTTLATKDPGKVQELVNLATNIKGKKGKEIGLKVFTEISAVGQEGKFDDRLAALSMLQKMDGKEFNLALYLKDPDNAVKKIDELVPLLNKVEQQKTINKKILLDLEKTTGMPDLKGLSDDWEYYVNLPDDVKKTVTETYIAIRKSITEDNIAEMAKAEAAKRGLRGSSAAAFIQSYGGDPEKLAAKLNRELYNSAPPANTIPGGGGGGGETGTRDTTLDNLLNRLKMVRDASINASGGIKELQRVTSGEGITKFSGVINQLMTGAGGSTGANRGFISFMESMDNATRKTYMTIKNGKVILTQAGKDLAEAFNEQTLGDFKVAQLDTVKSTQAQKTAFVKLKAAGVDSATALNMVADAELAIAINASVEPAKKLKEMADNAKSAKIAVDNLNLSFKQTMSSSIQELEMLKKLPGLIDQMNALGMNADQVQAVLDDPDFAREMLNNLVDGKIVSKELADYINSIPERKSIQIAVDMKTPGGMQKIFDESMGKAQEYFNTIEESIQLSYKQRIKSAQKSVDDARKIVEKYQKDIDGIQETINDKQRSIEINITRKIEEYQSQIDSMQEQIKSQFDKPLEALSQESNKLSNDLGIIDHSAASINDRYDTQIKALTEISTINSEIATQQKQQLTLADALTQGDISAAAAAVQDMRSTEAANQLNKQQGTLQAARDLEVANLRNSAGMTRAQIEERQYQIGQQSYTLEQQRKVIEDQIAAIQETKIVPLQAQKLIAEREIRDLEDKIYNIQVGSLATAQQILDDKQTLLDNLDEQLQKELDAIDAERDRWLEAQNAIDVARVKSEAFGTSMALNLSLVKQLVAAWNSMGSKTTTQSISPAQQAYDAERARILAMSSGPAKEAALAALESKYPNGRPMMYGGFVGGSGAGDVVPAMLTPGEFVMNKTATKAFGPMLSQMNSSLYPSMMRGSNLSSPVYSTGISNTVIPTNVSSATSVNNNSSSVYNYSVGINVSGSNSTPEEIARAVMTQIKYVDSQRIRGQ